MKRVLSPARIEEIHQSEIKRRARIKWERAGKPEGRDLEFWFSAEKEKIEEEIRFGGPLIGSALPDWTFNETSAP